MLPVISISYIPYLDAISNKKKVKIHTAGVNGEIGGYPYIIDATGSVAKHVHILTHLSFLWKRCV